MLLVFDSEDNIAQEINHDLFQHCEHIFGPAK